MTKFSPTISKSKQDKIRKWHEQTLIELRAIESRKNIRVIGERLVVLPGCFAPIFPDSTLLAQSVKSETERGDRVLDVGTGVGIHTRMAAKKAREVVAVDINKRALESAKLNLKRFKNVKVRKSNLFSNVNGIFDLIVFNPPFRWFTPKNITEKSESDKNYEDLKKFFKSAKRFLSRKGKIVMAFSDSGDMRYFEHLAKKNGYKSKILKRKTEKGWLYKIYRFTI